MLLGKRSQQRWDKPEATDTDAGQEIRRQTGPVSPINDAGHHRLPVKSGDGLLSARLTSDALEPKPLAFRI